MIDNHQVIIRTRKSDYTALLKGKIDFGHVGITLVNDQKHETHHDFASAIIHERYYHLSNQYDRTASHISLLGVMSITAIFTASAASSLLSTTLNFDHDALNSLLSTVSIVGGLIAGAFAGLLTAPTACVRLKREGSEESHAPNSYPKTNESFTQKITQDQYKKLLNKLEQPNAPLHLTGFYNCVHKVKAGLNDVGIETKKHLYDSPNRFRAELKTFTNT